MFFKPVFQPWFEDWEVCWGTVWEVFVYRTWHSWLSREQRWSVTFSHRTNYAQNSPSMSSQQWSTCSMSTWWRRSCRRLKPPSSGSVLSCRSSATQCLFSVCVSTTLTWNDCRKPGQPYLVVSAVYVTTFQWVCTVLPVFCHSMSVLCVCPVHNVNVKRLQKTWPAILSGFCCLCYPVFGFTLW